MITGASRGLGRALALRLGAAGARLILCARSSDPLAATAARAEDAGGDAIQQALDITDASAVRGLVDRAVERWGPVSALINNASLLGERSSLGEQDLDEWRRVVDVNLTGSLVAVQAVLPGMRSAGSGSIVNVTSGVGNTPRADWGAYAVSKWAVEALTWNLAREERASGIRVNAVDPGAMRTGMRAAAYPSEDPESLPVPREVAPVFLWLVSDASAEVTGQRFEAQKWEPGRDAE